MRRRDVAEALGVSESQVLKWEARGLLHPIDLKAVGGIRGQRLDAREVESLAERLIAGGRGIPPTETSA